MYQPYPGGAQMPEVQRPPAPGSVRNAVKLMYAGAVASLIGIAIDLTTLTATKNAMKRQFPNLTASQLTAQERPLMVGWIASGLVAAALWIFIARNCQSGKSWARITGTVLFGIATMDALGNLVVPEAALVKIFWFVIWLIGLGTVVFLWRGSSSAFFRGTRACDRLPRPERRRQDHHDADHPGPVHPHLGHGARRRQPLPGGNPPIAPGRRAAGRERRTPRRHRIQPPAVDRAEQRYRAPQGHGGTRADRARRGSAPAHRELLARHEAAARHRHGAARRPCRPDVLRTGGRPGHRQQPLDPPAVKVTGGGSPYRLRLQPPDERDGTARRPPAHHRPWQADRRHAHGPVRRVQYPRRRASAVPTRRRPRRATPRPRRGGHAGGRWRARRGRPRRAGHRGPGRRVRHRRARTGAAARLPRAGLPGHHQRQRRIPRRKSIQGWETRPVTTVEIRPARPAVPPLAIRARDVLTSEFTKLRSVRSTYWTLLIAVVTAIGLSAIVAVAFATPPPAGRPPIDPLLPSFISLEYAVLAVGVLGVLAFSSEHATGLIRTTFAAVPRRRAVLAAKAAAAGTVTLIVGELVSFASFFLVQAILSGHHLGVSLSHSGVPGAVLAEGTLLFVCAMVGLGLGAMIRHTAGAVAALVALIYLPAILGLLPAPWNDRIGRLTLFYAAQQVVALHPRTDLFAPAPSMLVLLAWPADALLTAAFLITRRDA